MQDYSHFDYKHHFACWAAARAAQRGVQGMTTKKVSKWIGLTGLKNFVANLNEFSPITAENYDCQHLEWCRILETQGISFGRAAKIVAVYIKAMLTTSNEAIASHCRHVHPPIDTQVLQALAKAKTLPYTSRSKYRSTSWTQLTELEYTNLIASIESRLAL